MAGPRLQALGLVAVLAVGCNGGVVEGDEASPSASAATTGASACAQRLAFSETSWEAAPSGAAPVPSGIVSWRARFTFSNPNPVEVRLSEPVVVLQIDSADGHRAGAGRTTFDETSLTIAPRSTVELGAQAWMRDGKIPKTTQVYVSTAASVGGAGCSVPIDRVSTTPPSPQVFGLPDCGSESC